MKTFVPLLDFSEPLTYFFWFFVLMMVVQLLFTLIVYGQVAFHNYKKQKVTVALPSISVLIAARNESRNLVDYLPFILEQDYPEFEVIVINHQSSDETAFVLKAFERQYSHLRIINIEKNQHLHLGKKIPLTLGVKGAKYDFLVLTDADCQPASDKWLRSMAARFSVGKQIVLGYGPLAEEKGFLNKLIRFDTAWIAMNYFSFAKVRMPYMGIGRNLAYKKELFDSVGGFKSHYGLASGDDDLFVQEAVGKKNYKVNLDPDSFCVSEPPKSYERWFAQKSRHYTTAPHYKVFKKMMLGIYPLSLLLGLISFVSLLCVSSFNGIVFSVFCFVLLMKWLIIGLSFKRLKEHKFIPWIPLWDIFYAIWTPIMYYSLSNAEKNKW